MRIVIDSITVSEIDKIEDEDIKKWVRQAVKIRDEDISEQLYKQKLLSLGSNPFAQQLLGIYLYENEYILGINANQYIEVLNKVYDKVKDTCRIDCIYEEYFDIWRWVHRYLGLYYASNFDANSNEKGIILP